MEISDIHIQPIIFLNNAGFDIDNENIILSENVFQAFPTKYWMESFKNNALCGISFKIYTIHMATLIPKLNYRIDFRNNWKYSIDSLIQETLNRLIALNSDGHRITFITTIAKEIELELLKAQRHRTPSNPNAPKDPSVGAALEIVGKYRQLLAELFLAVRSNTALCSISGLFSLLMRIALLSDCVAPVAGRLEWRPPLAEPTKLALREMAARELKRNLRDCVGIRAQFFYETEIPNSTTFTSNEYRGKLKEHLYATLDNSNFHPAEFIILYWAISRATQEFACSNIAFAHEDALTGAFWHDVERNLGGFGKEQFEKLEGKNDAKFPFDVATLRIAGTAPETDSKADIGLIFDIQLPGFRLRKALRVQAKNSNKGRANVWSDRDQLPELVLSNITSGRIGGVYAFYHKQHSGDYPAVTIRRPEELMAEIIRNNDTHTRETPITIPQLELTESRHWKVDTLRKSLPFSDFIVFEFLSNESNVGIEWENYGEALSHISSHKKLPHYLQFVSIGAEMNLDLVRDQIRKHVPSYELPRKRKENDVSPPELSALLDDLNAIILPTEIEPLDSRVEITVEGSDLPTLGL